MIIFVILMTFLLSYVVALWGEIRFLSQNVRALQKHSKFLHRVNRWKLFY